MKNIQPLRLIWSVEVLDLDSAFLRRQKDFFLHLINRTKDIHRERAPHALRIQPVYVLTAGQIGIASDAATHAMSHYLP